MQALVWVHVHTRWQFTPTTVCCTLSTASPPPPPPQAAYLSNITLPPCIFPISCVCEWRAAMALEWAMGLAQNCS